MSSWGCTSTIEQLYTNANGLIYVSTPLDETLANCTVYAGNYFVLNPEAKNAKEVCSSLLAAYMSDALSAFHANTDVTISESDQCGQFGVEKITDLQVFQ